MELLAAAAAAPVGRRHMSNAFGRMRHDDRRRRMGRGPTGRSGQPMVSAADMHVPRSNESALRMASQFAVRSVLAETCTGPDRQHTLDGPQGFHDPITNLTAVVAPASMRPSVRGKF